MDTKFSRIKDALNLVVLFKMVRNGIWPLFFIYTILVPHYYFYNDLFSHNLFILLKYLHVFLIAIAMILNKDLFLYRIRKWYGEYTISKYVLSSAVVYISVCLLSLYPGGVTGVNLAKLVYYILTGPALFFIVIGTIGNGYIEEYTRHISILTCLSVAVGVSEIIWGYKFLWSPELGLFKYPYTAANSLRPIFTSGNPLYSSTLFCLVLPIAMSLSVKEFIETKKIEDIKGFVFSVIIVAGILLSVSLGAYITIFFVISLLYMFFRRNEIQCTKYFTFFFLFVVAILCIVVSLDNKFLSQDGFGRITNKFESLEKFKEVHWERLHRYTIAINVAEKSPLLGIGFGTYAQKFDELKGNYPKGYESRVAENMFLTIFTETGTAGLLSFALLLTSILWNLSQIEDYRKQLFVIAIACSILNMFFWDSLTQPTVRMYFWFFAGLLFTTENDVRLNQPD